MRPKRYEMIPLSKLKQELKELKTKAAELEAVIHEIEKGERREIDIADSNTGDPVLVSNSILLDGERGKGRWYVRESIYCSLEKCPNCPHGEYFYEYRYNKRKHAMNVRFRGIPAFKTEDLEAMISYDDKRKPLFDEHGNLQLDD